MIALWWTNRSSPPSSGVMNPYPLSALNHFTVPVAIDETPPLRLENGQRRRTRASGTRSDSRPRVAASSEKPASGGFARLRSTGAKRGQPYRPRRERDAHQNEGQRREVRRPEALAKEDRSVEERDRRDEVGHERRVVGTGALDER